MKRVVCFEDGKGRRDFAAMCVVGAACCDAVWGCDLYFGLWIVVWDVPKTSRVGGSVRVLWGSEGASSTQYRIFLRTQIDALVESFCFVTFAILLL